MHSLFKSPHIRLDLIARLQLQLCSDRIPKVDAEPGQRPVLFHNGRWRQKYGHADFRRLARYRCGRKTGGLWGGRGGDSSADHRGGKHAKIFFQRRSSLICRLEGNVPKSNISP